MTLEELYGQIDGSYEEVMGRLRSEQLVERILGMFLDDSTCPDLVEAWGRGDDEAAFGAAHSAKGVCMNLALTRLGALTSQITEALRPGNDSLRAATDVDALVSDVSLEYAKVRTAITAYLA